MIRKKSSINIFHYENNGQQTFFGRDNLSFKTVNMPTKQHFDNICNVMRYLHTSNLSKELQNN